MQLFYISVTLSIFAPLTFSPSFAIFVFSPPNIRMPCLLYSELFRSAETIILGRIFFCKTVEIKNDFFITVSLSAARVSQEL